MAKQEITLKLLIETKGGKTAVQAVQQVNQEVKNVSKNTGIAAAAQDKFDKGTAAMGKNATANFAKISQGMGGLVHVYATVAANVFALSAAYEVLKRNADLTIMAKSAAELSRSTGVNFGALAKSMQNITGGAISFTAAMRQANLAISGGATVSQVEQITDIANKAANTLGLSVPDAVGRMIQAVTKGEPELVDELGIILRVTRATEDYAIELGKTATQLTTFEKQQAIMNQLITQGNEKFGEVAKATNPYEKLSAGFGDLTRSLIELVGGPLGGVASTISNNMVLMASGFAIVAHSLSKLILPSMLSVSEELNSIAKKDTKAATESMQAYERSVAAANRTYSELIKKQGAAKKFVDLKSKNPTATAALASIFKDDPDANEILGSLDKGRGIGNVFKTIIQKGAKAGASNADIYASLKEANVLPRLKRAIERELEKGGTSLFKKGTSEQTKAFILDNINSILDLEAAEKGVGELKDKLSKEEEKQQKARIQYLRAQAAQSVTTAKTMVLSHNTVKGSLDVLWSALSNINNKYNALAATGVQATSRIARMTEIATIRTRQLAANINVAATSLFKFLSSAVGKILPIVGTLTLVYEGVKGIAGALGLTNEEFLQNSSALRDVLKATKENVELFKGTEKELTKMPKTAGEVVQQFEKINNIAQNYTKNIQDLVNSMKFSDEVDFFTKILSPFSKGKEDTAGIEALITGMKELQDTTKETGIVTISTLDSSAEAYANLIREREALTERKKGLRSQTSLQAAQLDREIQKVNWSLHAAETRLRRPYSMTIDFSADEKTLKKQLAEVFSNLDLRKDLRAKIPGVAEMMTQPGAKRASASKAIENEVSNIQSTINKITQKSASKQVVSTDTFIQFRDGLAGIRREAAVLADSKEFQRLETQVQSLSDGFLTAFDLKGVSGQNTLSQLDKTIANMDKYINRLENAKTLQGQLEAVKGIMELERGSEDLTYLSAINGLEKQILQSKVEGYRAEIATAEAAKKTFENETGTVAKQDALITSYHAQIALLKAQLRTKTDYLVVLEEALIINKRNTDIIKSQVSLESQLESSLQEIKKAGESSASSLNLAYQATLKQKEASTRLLGANLRRIDLEKQELALNTKSLIASKKYASQEEVNNRLAELNSERQTLQVKEMTKQNELSKEAFDLANRMQSVTPGGFSNSFARFFDGKFWSDVSTEFGYIADEMARQTNSVKTMAAVVKSGIEGAVSTWVDALINDTWEGKDDGVSRTKAVLEATKSALRESIGSAIKENMVQAIARMIGGQNSLTASNYTLIGALNNLAYIMLTSSGGSSSASAIASLGSLFTMGAGGPGGTPVPKYADFSGVNLSLTGMAKGGLVHRPEVAMIGEGKNSEAVVPLPDNRSIPVRFEQAPDSGPKVNVTNHYDFRGADPASEARLRQFGEQIKADTIRQISNDINRGGQMAKTVGRR